MQFQNNTHKEINMAYEQKAGDGVLFKNKYKQDGDKKPDWKGSGLDLQGNKIELAGWIKQGKGGEFISLKLSVPMERKDPPPEKTDDWRPEGLKPVETPAQEQDNLPF